MQTTLKLENKASLEKIATKFPRSAARALNKVSKSMVTLAKKEITATYTVKPSKLGARFKQAKATSRNLAAGVRAYGRRLTLGHFKVRWNRRMAGTQVEVTRGKVILLRRRFIALMPSGHKGVFVRDEKRDSYRGDPRSSVSRQATYTTQLPIDEGYTLSAAELMTAKRVGKKMDSFAAKKLPQVLAHEVKYEMGKA